MSNPTLTPSGPTDVPATPADFNLIATAVELEASAPPPADGQPPRARRFSMTAYTGGPMVLAGWKFPVIVDLAGLVFGRQQRPILLDHQRDVEHIIGQSDTLAVRGHQLIVAGQVLGDSTQAQQVIGLHDRGFSWQASIGARAEQVEFIPDGKTVEVNGREFPGPVNVARRAHLGEISFVALGADENTTASIAAGKEAEGRRPEAGGNETVTHNQDEAFGTWVKAQGFEIEQLTEAQRTNLRKFFDAGRQPAPPVATIVGPIHGADDPVTLMRAQAAAERRRIFRLHQICGDAFPELEARAIAEGWDEARTELEVLRASRPKNTASPHGFDTTVHSAAAIEAALCLSAGLSEERVGKWYDQRTMEAAISRDLRGASLHTLLYEVIRAAGSYARPGRVDDDTIRAAFVANNSLIAASGTGFSTISLAGILSNIANKTMLAAYEAVNSVAQEICATTDVNDFKQVIRYRMTASGIFQKVGPDGELKSASLSEETYTNQVETFGRIIALTRQMLINDDLGAFLQIPRAIGRMSALALEEAVFTLLLSNLNNFFSPNNKNYFEGANSTLDIPGLTKAEQMFLDRVDSQGKPILITPAVLLVPTSLKVVAEQLFREVWLNQVPADNKPQPATNPHAGKFRPVSSPYLSLSSIPGNSSTAWYLLAEPTDVAAIEIAYLRGKRTPTIESGETDFDTLGMKWRGFFDFGVGLQDPRAAVKSKGAV